MKVSKLDFFSFHNFHYLTHSQARDDRLGLVYKLSERNMVAVNTAVGQTERVNIPEITAQGGTWGPMLCSNLIDTVGKYSEASEHNYMYKQMTPIIGNG